MNSKNTLTWFVVAVALFAFIVGYRLFQRSATVESSEVLPDLRPLAVTAVEVSPQGSHEICAVNTNGNWTLTQPVEYPAQASAIESLLDALQKLKPAERFNSADVSQGHDANSQFGFNSPSASLAIQSGDERRDEIVVGNKTAPGDQVYVRVVGREGVFVTDIDWLKFIPQSVNDWRDTALAADDTGCDSILLTNGTKIIELTNDPVSHLWQMVRPLAARANGDYIAAALQKLQRARVSQFVTDNSNADMSAFGLQPANLNLWLEKGSNVLAGLRLGRASTNRSTEIFAKREGWNAVVTTPIQPLTGWFGTINDFRDPYLFELTAPVAEIEMIGPGTNHFILDRQGNGWTIPGETFPVDSDSVQAFIQTLAGLRVSEFVKDVTTPADMPAYGLAKPSRQIILRPAVGDTNAVIAQLLFGGARTNEVFAQRSDENSIYAITPEDFNSLPAGPAWQFRDRRIWNFSEGDVTNIIVRQNGKTMEVLHNGPNKWSLAPGSQGIINGPGIEYLAQDLGELAVGSGAAWWSRGVPDPARVGLKPGNLSITVTLKDGQMLTMDFGLQLGQTALAATTLDGERWVFIFPPEIYQLIMSYLAISPNVP